MKTYLKTLYTSYFMCNRRLTVGIMHKLLFLIFFVSCRKTYSFEEVRRSTPDVGARSNFVANDVYQIIAAEGERNVLFCPISFNILMALTTVAAHGKTLNELKEALHLQIANDEITYGYKKFLGRISDKRLKVATGIYPNKGTVLVPEFVHAARENFKSKIKVVDYSYNKRAAKIINKFVEKHTHRKIKNIVDANDLSADTALLLVNAAYFKDEWRFLFDKKRTFDGYFYLSFDEKVKTKMMSNTNNYKYLEMKSLDAKFLEIPFKTKGYNMLIVLPNKLDGIHEVENKLNTNILNRIQLSERYIELTIPKFKIETKMDLNSVCKKLGIRTLFTSEANLKGLTKGGVSVSGIVQKTYIKVDENGVEAAAVTGIVVNKASPIRPLEFKVNHPFMFFLRRSNLIYFQGRLSRI